MNEISFVSISPSLLLLLVYRNVIRDCLFSLHSTLLLCLLASLQIPSEFSRLQSPGIFFQTIVALFQEEYFQLIRYILLTVKMLAFTD